MKKFKIIITLLLVFLLTGCAGNYDITINKDLSIKEELNLELVNTGNEYNKTLKIFEDNNINKDNYHVFVNGTKVVIKYNENFSSIDDYILNSKLYHQLIDEIKFSNVDDNIDIYINQNLKLKNDDNNIGNLSDIDFLQINIKNPYKVIVSNEDSYNQDIYSWTITKDTINKKILMQFEPKSDEFPYGTVIMIIVLSLCTFILVHMVVKSYKNAHKI